MRLSAVIDHLRQPTAAPPTRASAPAQAPSPSTADSLHRAFAAVSIDEAWDSRIAAELGAENVKAMADAGLMEVTAFELMQLGYVHLSDLQVTGERGGAEGGGGWGPWQVS